MIYDNENEMVDKSKLSKDVEEQIQSLASDVYIQVEGKITHLIAAAVKAEISQAADQQNKKSLEQEQALVSTIDLLKQELAEKKLDGDVNKQNFQVELTQKSINYTETIERLEKEIVNLQQLQTQQQAQRKDNRIDEKLLETEQYLNDKTQEVDGLNGRIMVLTEQEQSLTKQLVVAKEHIQLSEKQKSDAVTAIKVKAELLAKQQIDALTDKHQQLENENARIQAEALQNCDSKINELAQTISQLTEQAQQEKNGKAELQQQLSAQQQSSDTEQVKNKQVEQKNQDYQAQIIKLTEQASIDKQKRIDELKSINEAGEQIKKIQAAAQQKITELETVNKQLSNKVEMEQKDIKLYQQEVAVLNDQVKVAQQGQENILQRFNSNRDKQEIENNKVRETIKFLRDENHQLISDNDVQKVQFSEQISELEHKSTEYRLKFEYAQKQLTK